MMIWLVVWNTAGLWLSIIYGIILPNWRTHIFQMGRYTTNHQSNIIMGYCFIWDIWHIMGSCSRLPYCLIWMIPGRLFFSLVLNPAWQEWWNHEAAWVHHFKPIAGGNFRGNTLNFKTFRCAYPSDSFQICGLGVHVKIVFVYDIHVLCIYIYIFIYIISPLFMASCPQVYENLLLQMFETFVAKDDVVTQHWRYVPSSLQNMVWRAHTRRCWSMIQSESCAFAG